MADEASMAAKAGSAAAEIAKLSYADALQAAAKEFGEEVKPAGRELAKAVNTAAKAFNSALRPLGWFSEGVDVAQKFWVEVLREVAGRFQDKEDRVAPPKPSVAVPVLQGVALTEGEPDLQAMYFNLLEASMDRNVADTAHPAFAGIIGEMTSDEAKAIRFLAERGAVKFECREESGSEHLRQHFTAPAGIQRADLFNVALNNRLFRHFYG